MVSEFVLFSSCKRTWLLEVTPQDLLLPSFTHCIQERKGSPWRLLLLDLQFNGDAWVLIVSPPSTKRRKEKGKLSPSLSYHFLKSRLDRKERETKILLAVLFYGREGVRSRHFILDVSLINTPHAFLSASLNVSHVARQSRGELNDSNTPWLPSSLLNFFSYIQPFDCK